MSEPFLGEIRLFGCNFAPRSWALCNGQLLPISQATALFSLLGTNYGGNGTTTFGLPNLQGQAAMQHGSGPGLTPRVIGEVVGSPYVTLLPTEMPSHSHSLAVSASPANASAPESGQSLLARSVGGQAYSTLTTASTQLSLLSMGIAGSSQPHNNLQPYLAMNYCIALEGVFPQRP